MKTSTSKSVRDDVETLVMDAQVLEEHPQGRRPGEEGQGDRNQTHRPPAEASRQSEVHGAGRAAGEGEGAARAGISHQPGVPERDAGTGEGGRRGREGGRSGGGAGPSEGGANGALQGSQREEHTHHRRTHRRRHRRHREEGAVSPTGSIPLKESGWCKRNSGARCSNTSCTRIRSLFDKAYGYIRQYY